MDDQRLIEELQGVGKIFRGSEFFKKAHYDIEIYQKYSQGVPTLKKLEGRVSLSDDDTIPFMLKGEILTLEMEDGRRVGFFFSSSDGTIANATGIYDPKTEKEG